MAAVTCTNSTMSIQRHAEPAVAASDVYPLTQGLGCMELHGHLRPFADLVSRLQVKLRHHSALEYFRTARLDNNLTIAPPIPRFSHT